MKLPAASYGVSQQRIFLIITLQAAGYLPKERIKIAGEMEKSIYFFV